MPRSSPGSPTTQGRWASVATFQQVIRKATHEPEGAHNKRPLARPEQVLAYLSRYTHRVGISKGRLLALDRRAGAVTFDYRDYAQGAQHKSISRRSSAACGWGALILVRVIPPLRRRPPPVIDTS